MKNWHPFWQAFAIIVAVVAVFCMVAGIVWLLWTYPVQEGRG